MFPLVSVVTSVYNSETYIAKTIESILNQTFTDFEFILVDDGSKDHTGEIIESYAKKDNRIVVIHNETNIGVVRGLNRGLEKVRGKYIARQDGDDISLPERFARQVDFLDQNPAYAMVGCRVIYIDENDLPSDATNPFTPTENEEIQQKLLENNYLCGPAVMIRRTSLEKAGFWFTEGLDSSEDYDINLRLAEVGKVAALAEPLFLYRKHSQSLSITHEYKQALRKAIALERAIGRRWKEQAPSEVLSIVARDYLWSGILAYTQGDLEGAGHCFVKMLAADPAIVGHPEIFERLIWYRLPATCDEGEKYIQNLFTRFIPPTRHMKGLRTRLISSIHMKEFFSGAERGDRAQVFRHLWPGISNNPRMLLNRGVLIILLRSVLGRLKK